VLQMWWRTEVHRYFSSYRIYYILKRLVTRLFGHLLTGFQFRLAIFIHSLYVRVLPQHSHHKMNMNQKWLRIDRSQPCRSQFSFLLASVTSFFFMPVYNSNETEH